MNRNIRENSSLIILKLKKICFSSPTFSFFIYFPWNVMWAYSGVQGWVLHGISSWGFLDPFSQILSATIDWSSFRLHFIGRVFFPKKKQANTVMKHTFLICYHGVSCPIRNSPSTRQNKGTWGVHESNTQCKYRVTKGLPWPVGEEEGGGL